MVYPGCTWWVYRVGIPGYICLPFSCFSLFLRGLRTSSLSSGVKSGTGHTHPSSSLTVSWIRHHLSSPCAGRLPRRAVPFGTFYTFDTFCSKCRVHRLKSYLFSRCREAPHQDQRARSIPVMMDPGYHQAGMRGSQHLENKVRYEAQRALQGAYVQGYPVAIQSLSVLYLGAGTTLRRET